MLDSVDVILVGEYQTIEEADDVKGNLFVYDIPNVHVLTNENTFRVIVAGGTSTIRLEDIVDQLLILGYNPSIIKFKW